LSALLWIDGLFADFCGSFSGSLRDEARRLPFSLGFAPDPATPWSHVFSHEMTLAAPALLAEAMPSLPESVVRDALFAHALAVIEAMGTDRIEDGQVEATPALQKVLAAARARRDELLDLVADGATTLDPAAADRELRDAARQEGEILAARRKIDFALYEALSARKQAPGMLAAGALAARAGWSPARAATLRRVVLGAALGLQLHDDVLDWEDDAQAGRSWALSLARSQRGDAVAREAAVRAWRIDVHEAGVLARMLKRAGFHFHAASRRAAVLGARRLATWAAERAASLRYQAEREAQSAGYVSRARELRRWARTVLDPRA
jgi:hypothetical protein